MAKITENYFTEYSYYIYATLVIRYKKYNGISNYFFVVGTNKNVQFDYEVTVEKGSLELIFSQGKHIIFQKEFYQDEKGSFSFTPSKKICLVAVTGKYTKGSCQVTFNKVDGENQNQDKVVEMSGKQIDD